MRTTLSLDEDVAALLERVRKRRKQPQKALINEGLRQGFRQMLAPRPKTMPFQTDSVDLGTCLVGNLDDVAEVLAIAEGENFQ